MRSIYRCSTLSVTCEDIDDFNVFTDSKRFHPKTGEMNWKRLILPGYFKRLHSTSKIDTRAVEFLKNVVGEENLSVSRAVLEAHGKDEGPYRTCPPEAVIWPTSINQISEVLRWCDSSNIPVTPYGSGTGLEGGINAIHGGICISVKKLNRVVEVNAEDFDCLVEAGVTWRQLNAELKSTGLWFTVDPGASASIGGMTSTSASGTNSVRYGTMKDNVLNMEVVLPNGSVINTGGERTHSKKSSAGYDLTSLFLGSEGTLGVVTKIRVKLRAQPEKISAAICPFPSEEGLIETAVQALQAGVSLAKIEYLDEASIMASKMYHKSEFPHNPCLFAEFHGSDASIKSSIETFKDIAVNNGCINFEYSSLTEKRNQLWKFRHELFYACRAQMVDCRMLVTDVCVPISKLKKIVVWARKTLQDMNLKGYMLGHVGDGNFHISLPSGMNDEETYKKTQEFALELARIAIKLGGTCTGEHGVGRGKRNLLKEQYSPFAINLMRSIKFAIDPNNIMNPGKVV